MEELAASLEEKSEKLKTLQSDYDAKASEYKGLEETSKSSGERMERLEAEGDALREEIR